MKLLVKFPFIILFATLGIGLCDAKPTKEEYNDQGKIARQYYFGEDNIPYMGPEGFFMAKYLYDNQGRLHKILYFNTEGKSCEANSPDGIKCASIEYTYDANGKQSAKYFNKKGEEITKTSSPKSEK